MEWIPGSDECINAHDVVRFFHFYNVGMRAMKQNWETTKADIVDNITKWCSTFSDSYFMARVGTNYDEKGGHFTPKE